VSVSDTPLVIASDHGGYELKRDLCARLVELGMPYVDLGPTSNESVDYPDYAAKVACAVSSGEYGHGVLVCGSGIGMSIAANKIPGIRAAVVQDLEHARLAREHNNANVLCLGGRFTAPDLAVEMIQVWYKSECNGERHHRRLGKIASLESAPVSEQQGSGE
jgi:ribose 5-phosphate isomerase B